MIDNPCKGTCATLTWEDDDGGGDSDGSGHWSGQRLWVQIGDGGSVKMIWEV